MILVNELRFGNYLLFGKQIQCVFKITGDGVNTYCNDIEISDAFENIHPIPLTKDWLLKFGFKEGTSWYSKYEHPIAINISIKHGLTTVGANEEYEVECKYVHQLQNLYFALTGKELEIINQ